jgi:hypothetical protein
MCGTNFGGGETRIYTLSLSGNTITVLGTTYIGKYFNSGPITAICSDPVNNRLLCIVGNSSTTDYEWVACTPGASSVTSINNPGSATGTGYGGEGYADLAFDVASTRILMTWQDSSNWGASKVFNMATANPTVGSNTFFNSGSTGWPSLAYDGTSKFVVMYSDSSVPGSQSVGQVATVSGTTVTWGSKQVHFTGSSGGGQYNAAYNTVTGSVGFVYNISNVQYFNTATISGTSLSFGTTNTVIGSITNTRYRLIQVGTNSTMFTAIYSNQPGSLNNYGLLIRPAYTSYNITSTNFIGFSDGTYTNGQTATVKTVGGTTTAQSGLTAGSAYYVINTGAISTTAGSPSVFAGTAVSATTLLVKG